MKKKFRKDKFAIRTIREWMMLGLDMILIALCFIVSVILAQVYILNMPSVEVSKSIVIDAFKALPVVLLIFAVVFILFRVSKVVWRYARGKDYLRLVAACLVALLIFIILDEFALHWVAKPDTKIPESSAKFSVYPAYINFGVSSVATTILLRLCYEFFYSRETNKGKVRNRKRTLIIGAGLTANTILDELTRIDSLYEPVCLVDDDPEKKHRIMHELEVVDDTTNIPAVVERYGIEVIIFAIPSIDDLSRKRIMNDCSKTACQIKVLPYVRDIITNIDFVRQMRDINIADLLGRAQITFDDDGVSKYIKNKTALVTGGGGSIGSELCRQIVKYKPKRIVVVDVYENCVYDIQQELKIKYGAELDFCAEILSITDFDKVDDLFEQYKPDIIFHAAAHKHVPLMETNPEEAVKNNVYGTLNVVELAQKHKVKKFIMISTDKAVNPTNVMGATKRCCEKIVQMYAAQNTETEFAAVRFGNVLGSNGSVIPLFKRQIQAGGPVTVTHKDIIRFFMTIPEAVSLVLQAGAFASGGEVFVLDMGEQVKIVKLAENLISMMGFVPYREIDIKFTGLRPGEKLYEELLMNEEGLKKTSNNKIYIGQQLDFDTKEFSKNLEEMRLICATNDKEKVVEKLKQLVPTFNHDRKSLDQLLIKYEMIKKENIEQSNTKPFEDLVSSTDAGVEPAI